MSKEDVGTSLEKCGAPLLGGPLSEAYAGLLGARLAALATHDLLRGEVL
jgi:hypothetical protein